MTERGARRSSAPGAWVPLLGTLVAVGTWVVLVLVAIRFGERGRDGDAVAWVYLGLVSLAAVVCLVVALALGRQWLAAAGIIRGDRGKRARR